MSNNKILLTVHFKNESKKVSVTTDKTIQVFTNKQIKKTNKKRYLFYLYLYQDLIEQDIATRLELQDISYFSVCGIISGTGNDDV